jgi:3',5'-cyclic AMP phosphodiesterase CpdA
MRSPDPLRRPLTRRAALTGAAGAALGAAVLGRGAGEARAAGPYIGGALEPELVTVTDTSMVAWWWTDEATDTTIRITPVGGPDDGVTRELRLEEGRQVHVAKVDGLRPGQEYRYVLLSGGLPVSLGLGAADPGSFRTLVPPPGRRLATIALINDLHVGERCSGQLVSLPGDVPFPSCFSADDYPDYAHRMVAAAIDELDAMDLDLVIANGDLTDRGRPDEISRALAQLRRFSPPVLITRGNHDRRLQGACATDGDCLRQQAFPGQAVGDATLRSVARVGTRLGVVGLDSADPDNGDARLDLGDQAAWLDARLGELGAEGRDAIVAFHHPLMSGGVPAEGGADAVLAVIAKHPHVRLVVHGHTHANEVRTHEPVSAAVPFLQNGAIKEYPSGYCLLHVHEGGIMRTFHRPVNDWTRTWTATSARQVYGLHPSVTRGTLDSRAFVVRYASRGDRPTAAAAGASGAGLAGATAAPSTAGRRRGLDVSAARRITLAGLRRRGLVVGVHVPADAELELRLVAQLGRRDGLRRARTVTLATTRRRAAAGTVRLRLRPTAVGRALLRPVERHLSARVEVVARPRAGGSKRRARRAVRLLHRG